MHRSTDMLELKVSNQDKAYLREIYFETFLPVLPRQGRVGDLKAFPNYVEQGMLSQFGLKLRLNNLRTQLGF